MIYRVKCSCQLLSQFVINFVSLCNTVTLCKKFLSQIFVIINLKFVNFSQREKCPNTEFFSGPKRTGKNSVLGHFPRIVSLLVTLYDNFFQKGPKRVYEIFLLQFVIKTVFTKDLDGILILGQTWSKNSKLSLKMEFGT